RMNHAYNLLNLHSYQAGLAEQVRRRTGMPVRAVGGIADPRQAQAIIETGQADQVALARAFLADPQAWFMAAARRPQWAARASRRSRPAAPSR
ncbi:oxidoreductase, partial [Bordetella pertussis]